MNGRASPTNIVCVDTAQVNISYVTQRDGFFTRLSNIIYIDLSSSVDRASDTIAMKRRFLSPQLW